MSKGLKKRYISSLTGKAPRAMRGSMHFKKFYKRSGTKLKSISSHVTVKSTPHTKHSFVTVSAHLKSGYSKKRTYVAERKRYVGRRTARRSRR